MDIRKLWRAVVYRLCTLIWPVLSLFGAKAKFAFVYRMNLWGNPESISGDGSTMEYTENIREQLPLFFKQYGIGRVFDAPCGDYNWFRHIERDGVAYVGGDIVDAMVRENQRKFGDSDTSFVRFDIRNSPFSKAGLWFCRDCMFHLPTHDVMAAFGNFAKSDIPYVLTTSHLDTSKNTELPRGGFRTINLELPPYNFPKPSFSIDDWVPGYPRRILGLWTREEVRAAVATWKKESR